ncbi:MAG: response regulator [Alphaproteobacteria bacterium]|nr:response regulator [Alphaproteobacteria bacterium]
MTLQRQVLIVEDEPDIAQFISAALENNGYVSRIVGTGVDCLRICSGKLPDIVILDLGLPDMDGQEIIRAIRAWSKVPIIVLSARDQEEQKVLALERGADDYLTKPFGMKEFLARVRVVLRHVNRRETLQEAAYCSRDLIVDLARRKVSVGGNETRLTPTEYNLLAVLVAKAGQIVTHAELLREVWGRGSEEHSHYLRIYIQRLRQKLGDDPLYPRHIFTEPGIGYRISAEDET